MTSCVGTLCWILAMLTCAAVCGFQIANVWTRWYVSPVIISFAQRTTRVSEIPFPAITICPVMQIPRNVFDMDTVMKPENVDDPLTFVMMKQNLSSQEQLLGETVSMLCDGVNVHNSFTPNESHFQSMAQLSPNIEYFIHLCDNSEAVYSAKECAKYFRSFSSNSEVCHTFNLQTEDDVFVHPTHDMKQARVTVQPNASLASSEKTVGREFGLGITLKVPVEQKQISCLFPYLRNKDMFKVFVHAPSDYPLYGAVLQTLSLTPWTETDIRLRPTITTTHPSLRAYPPQTRGCRFPDEHNMKIFKSYSKHHCEIECNMLRRKEFWCGCIKITSFGERAWQRCVSAVPIKNCQKILNDLKIHSEMCEYCFPSCDEIRYDRDIMIRTLDIESVSAMKDDSSGLMIAANTTGYTYARMVIYFEEHEYLGIHRSEVFGFTDVLSNCGGLLGLFTGFSVITMVEVCYFATLRLCCNIRYKRSRTNTSSDVENTEGKTPDTSNAFAIAY